MKTAFNYLRISVVIATCMVACFFSSCCHKEETCVEKEQIVSEEHASEFKDVDKFVQVMSTKGPIDPATAWEYIAKYQDGRRPTDTTSWLITKKDLKSLLSLKDMDMVHIFLSLVPDEGAEGEHLSLIFVPVVDGKNTPYRKLIFGGQTTAMKEYVTPCPRCIYEEGGQSRPVDFKACDLEEFKPNPCPAGPAPAAPVAK